MTDQMTRLQQESEKRYPDIPVAPENTTLIVNMRAAFIAGRTISAEPVEVAARKANVTLCQHRRDGLIDTEVFHEGIELERAMTRAALEAAGMVIEGS